MNALLASLVVVSALFCGCAAPSQAQPSHFMIHLDPTLTEGDVVRVETAAAAWSNATASSVHPMTYEITKDPMPEGAGEESILVVQYDETDNFGGGQIGQTHTNPGEPSTVRLSTFEETGSKKEAQLVVTHEMGHALGLGHTPDHVSLMCPGDGMTCTSYDITATDVAQYESLFTNGKEFGTTN